MKIYISGKITGETHYIEKFSKAYAYLMKKYHKQYKDLKILNPIILTNHLKAGSSWEDYMKICIKELIDCDIIYMLNDWRRSKGAILEHEIASQLKIKIIYQGEIDENK